MNRRTFLAHLRALGAAAAILPLAPGGVASEYKAALAMSEAPPEPHDTVDPFLPEIWSKEIVKAYKENLVLRGIMRGKT